jgi:hypothetical protein
MAMWPRPCGVHVWRLAHDIDFMSDEAVADLLQQMIADTSERRR